MSDIQKKRGRPATGKTPIAPIRLPADLRQAIDRAIAAGPEVISRSEFIRRLLTEHLKAGGYLNAPTFKERMQANIEKLESLKPPDRER